MIKHITAALLVLTGFISALAQTANIDKLRPKPIPQSPNAAALGKFGSYEVNLYNGLPQISIPIFEVKSGSLTLPITLDYHASGIKIFDPGSWVGYGWSLSAGGQITRDVRGEADELGYYFDPLAEIPTTSSGETQSARPYVCGPTGNWDYIEKMTNGVYDTDPDIFSYSVPDGSGNFALGHSSESPYTFPYSPIKIWHSGMAAQGPSFGLTRFEITSEDGTLYRFGQNSLGVLAGEGTSANSVVVQTAWNLMEMVAPNTDDQISINYQHGGNAYIVEPYNNITVVDNCGGDDPTRPCPQLGISSLMAGSNGSIVSQNVPKEIFFEGGKVIFVLGAQRSDNFQGWSTLKPLDSIKIYTETNGAYALKKVIKFKYSYFTYSQNPNSTVRLKLDEVQFIDAAGATVNSYKLSYHTNTLSWDQVWNTTPNEGLAKDFWGYFNGQPNTDLIPTQNISYTINGVTYINSTIGSANRETNPTYMKEGVLSRIVFPTGGFTDFDYETNRYFDSESNSIKYAGGLRVTSIKSYSSPGANPITKTYRYGVNESGNGVKNFFSDQRQLSSEISVRYVQCMTSPSVAAGITQWRERTYFSNPLFEMGARDGSPVVYPIVTEYIGDPTNNIGKIVHEFDNGLFNPDELQMIFGPPSASNYKIDMSWKRGKLTKQFVYDKLGALLSEKVINYTTLNSSQRQIGTIYVPVRTYVSPAKTCPAFGCLSEFGDLIDPEEFSFRSIYQKSGVLVETSTIETTYPNGDLNKLLRVTTETDYDPTFLQVLSQKTLDTNVGTEQTVTQLKYPFSYTLNGTLTGAAKAAKSLLDKGIFSTPLEKITLKQNQNGTNARVIAAEIFTFKENTVNQSQILPDEVFYLKTSSGLTNYTPASFNTSNMVMDTRFEPRLKMKQYDRRGNITEVQKSKDIVSSYLWGYNETMPIAEIQNSDIGLVSGPATYFYGSDVSTNQSSYVALTPSLVIDYPQTVNYSISIFQFSGTPTLPPTLDVELRRSDGSIVFNPPFYELGNYSATITLQPDTYTFYYKGQSNSSTIRFNITVNHTAITSYPKVFHTSFEETGITIPDAISGKKGHQGTYTIKLPSYTGDYVLTYWKRAAPTLSPWSLITVPITLPGTGSNITIGSASEIIDEVRMVPKKATITTYTYDPIYGMTTSNDANNNVTYYEYDNFGRLKLLRDAKGKILKHYTYNYKN